MDILCFATSKDNHNISVFIEVFARDKPLPDDIVGSPCVNIDIEDGKIYTSTGLATGLAKKADYWGEGTATAMPYQVKQHILTKRKMFCEPDDPRLPVTEDGEAIPVETLFTDNSELVELFWREVVATVGGQDGNAADC